MLLLILHNIPLVLGICVFFFKKVNLESSTSAISVTEHSIISTFIWKLRIAYIL